MTQRVPYRIPQGGDWSRDIDTKIGGLRRFLESMWERLAHGMNDIPSVSQDGTATVSGAATSVTVTFATAEPDSSYFLAVTPTVPTGGPAAGSNRILSISKTASGFTLNVESAPAGAATMAFDYAVIR